MEMDGRKHGWEWARWDPLDAVRPRVVMAYGAGVVAKERAW
jgi:hypothetical protein